MADERLALRGGTAINLFYRDMPRYSVDLDLIYLPQEGREETFKNIHSMLNEIKANVEAMGHTVSWGGASDSKKLFIRNNGQAQQVKVEINYICRGSLFPAKKVSLCEGAKEEFNTGEIEVNSLGFSEVFGGKICATLDRNHPRDFFDIKILLENEGITSEMKDAFILYLISSRRPMHELLSPQNTSFDKDAYNNFQGMIVREGMTLDKLNEVKTRLVNAVMDALTEKDRLFLKSFVECRPDWNLVRDAKIRAFPAVKWKLENLSKMPSDKRKQNSMALNFCKKTVEQKKLYYKYWGKASKERDGVSHHLLPYHLLDVAAVGKAFLEEHSEIRSKYAEHCQLEEKVFSRWFVFFLALHDMGKFAESFQGLRPDIFQELKNGTKPVRKYRNRHDKLGYTLWDEHLKKQFQIRKVIPQNSGSILRQSSPIDYWINAVVGHHGCPPDGKTDTRLFDDDFSPEDCPAVSQFLDDILELLLPQKSPFPELENSSAKKISWWLSGLAVFCDWLGSNTKFFPYQKEKMDLSDYWKESCKRARKAIREVGMMKADVSDSLDLGDLLGKTNENTLTPLQKTVREWEIPPKPHLFILEDVTGSGKTEAAILLAHRLMKQKQGSGLYFALPTMATSNTMHARMRNAYAKIFSKKADASLILAHGSRDMCEGFRQTIVEGSREENNSDYGDGTGSASAHCNSWLADNKKKSLLADVGVGTIDQALLAILSSRHQSLRLLGLMNKILIIDEVHAYDSYTHKLLRALLYAHASIGGSAILLSATLPLKYRQELLDSYSQGLGVSPEKLEDKESYPLITSLSRDAIMEEPVAHRPLSERSLKINFLSEKEKIFDMIGKAVSENKCVCWIRNTVADAMESYEELVQRIDREIILFHARYALGDRLEIENNVIKSFGKESSSQHRSGKVLIATQVVEQSLDLDFDVLITDLAPIDLLLQRAGRLQRHSRDKVGNLLNGKDQRGIPCLNIFPPPFTENPSANWYKDFFPKGSNVYRKHGELWLSCKVLIEKKTVRIPQDVRALVESVYGEDAEIPKGLQKRDDEARGEDTAKRQMAGWNKLSLDDGYTREGTGLWWDEGKPPTRSGEPTITVYLAKKQSNGEITPWFEYKEYSWHKSAVSINFFWLEGYSNPDIPQIKELPDKGKWSRLLPLSFDSEKNKWTAEVMGKNGKSYFFAYSKGKGLETSLE